MSGDEGSPMEWREGGPPRSRLFGDVYFSAEDGLAEARQVFLSGCDLPAAWRDRGAFCVAELGFGTGLNVAALLELWGRERPPGGHLTIFSVEGFPADARDAARALSAWPELSPASALLVARWPSRARGFHRLDLPELGATLDVAVMEVAEALEAWSGRADAWFLDGFSPALNADMWRPEVLALVAARSAAGARLGAYTAAGFVRRGLAAAGFAVERRPGFGRKRHRIEARWPGATVVEAERPRVAIIGAGIAGAALAKAFRALGANPRVFAAHGPAASNGPAALVSPRLDAGLGPAAALFAQALARAGALYAGGEGWIVARGAVQLAMGPKDESRFAAIAGADLFAPGDMRRLGAPNTSSLLGEAAPAGLMIAPALAIHPAPVLDSWLGGTDRATVASLAREDGVWRLFNASGDPVAEAETVCVAAGMESARLVAGVPLAPVRGQASFAPGASTPMAILFGGYVAPAPGGVVFGATHDRGDVGLEPRVDDHRRNLDAVAAVLPALAARLRGPPLEARVGVRATTSDYLPIAGPAPGAAEGLFVLTGLGSRGFTLAPLLAEHVAALALARPSPLPGPLAALVDPARFAQRARRRGRPVAQ